MEVKSATEASQIVKLFLTKMGWSTMVSPVKAEKVGNKWFVEFTVGFRLMKFEIDATTGDVLKYGPKQ